MVSKIGRKGLWLLWVGALCLLPGLAQGGSYQKDVYVQPASAQEALAQQSSVQSYKDGKITTLFLPSGWDGIPLALYYPGEKTLLLDGKPFPSGSTLPLLHQGMQLLLTNERDVVQHRINVMIGTGIPAVFVSTESGSMKGLDRSKANKETGGFLLYGVDGALENNVNIQEIRGRGNSTYNANFKKRAYQVRLESSSDLCGMGKAKVYNLMADYLDISLLRSRISLDMAKQVGIPYALDCQSINLYLNGRYNGVYLLTEKIGINKSRLDIYDLERATEAVNGGSLEDYTISREVGPKRQWYTSYDIPNNPDNITGGYILELEYASRVTKPTNGIRTSNGAHLVIKEPTRATREQAKYIGEIFDRYHRAILSQDGVDPQSGQRYDELVDTDSMALVLILQEICKNYDHEQGSLFFFKDVDGVSTKVYAGPVWDFDRTYGSVQTERWLNSANNMLYQGHHETHYLYGNVYNKQTDFRQRVQELYQERYQPALAILLGEQQPKAGDTLRSLEDYRAEIEPSVRMNFTYWDSYAILLISKYSGRYFEASYEYLERFLQNRRTALDSNWTQD